ncbi:hypothetical protein CAI21_04045 [Alkalilimnicola ehrlichii]|uniref:DUF1579 domain-containing protein n=1 Tax=Alkalilimnicola ehrlichii TaxID=351052 RepID=A0A3E0X1R3_9GAMM|nr:hypothetical protein [Alkalilimnicola ehrlichii]RFA30694.1 hypothetical protein CAI21_04045 [Alkalilimnicola ehrlichii]RFA38272.1 hypothetical protein CAL65_05415 [Alkalilimnicola ehrlichii]
MTEKSNKPGDMPEWLLGAWRLQRAEPGVQILPGTGMEFRRDGKLCYRIPMEEEVHIFELEYEIEGDWLRTQHDPADHAQAVRFCLAEDGSLELDFNGTRAWFRREGLH